MEKLKEEMGNATSQLQKEAGNNLQQLPFEWELIKKEFLLDELSVCCTVCSCP